MTASGAMPIEIGLALQGGGALGAYECGALQRLLELMTNARAAGEDVTLRAVSGISIGALNAACVVGAADWTDAARRLGTLWDDLTLQMPQLWSLARWNPASVGGPNFVLPRDLSLWGLPGFYFPRVDYLNFRHWTSFYDTSPLEKMLKKHIDFPAINRSKTRLSVSAVNVTSGELTRFQNFPEPDEQKAGACNHCVEIAPCHLMASASLPPQFPWTKIGDDIYWDGGLVDNTPLGAVMDGFSAGREVKRVAVVMNLYPLRGSEPKDIAGVLDRSHELMLGNRSRQDSSVARHINTLIETIDALLTVAPHPLSDQLAEKVAMARLFKTVEVIEIDFQQPEDGTQVLTEQAFDDADGLRDFSPDVIRARRELGRSYTSAKLQAVFPGQAGEAERRAAPIPADGVS